MSKPRGQVYNNCDTNLFLRYQKFQVKYVSTMFMVVLCHIFEQFYFSLNNSFTFLMVQTGP